MFEDMPIVLFMLISWTNSSNRIKNKMSNASEVEELKLKINIYWFMVIQKDLENVITLSL